MAKWGRQICSSAVRALCRRSLLIGALLAHSFNAVHASPVVELPASGLRAEQLAVVYLAGNADSEKIARYYQAARQIPAGNVVPIKLDATQTVIDPGEFSVQKKALDARLGPHIQAYALAWAQPYRVGCMSISAAFAFGYDVAYCAQGCKLTRSSPYYHAGSVAPFTDFALRPTMLLAANNFNDARALIDRGVAADDSQPFGTAYLLQTSDRARSVRRVFYAEAQRRFAGVFNVQVLQQDAIANRSSILFYFTGRTRVEGLDSLDFLPGAMADHLTSYGGMLTSSKQMSAMRWLEAGATGSYGTALEPCAFTQKFPNPVLAMWHYATGSTLLEAYWKSVQMPGQGNFIGEPLAAPYAGYRLRRAGRTLRVYSPVLRRGSYKIYRNDFGVERLLAIQQLKRNQRYLELTPPFSHSYRIERM